MNLENNAHTYFFMLCFQQTMACRGRPALSWNVPLQFSSARAGGLNPSANVKRQSELHSAFPVHYEAWKPALFHLLLCSPCLSQFSHLFSFKQQVSVNKTFYYSNCIILLTYLQISLIYILYTLDIRENYSIVLTIYSLSVFIET